MISDIFFLILGLALILVGANILTDGASVIAKRWGVSDLIIGLTVVAFGTSAPELVISLISAIQGNAELAIGNVVGSNIFNVLVIIGVTAMVMPIKVERSIMTNEIPLVILSSFALLVMGNTPLLDGASVMALTRSDGIVLLLFFMIFMRYTFAQAKTGVQSGDEDNAPTKAMPMWKAIVWVIGGLAALIYGGDRFVAGASGIGVAARCKRRDYCPHYRCRRYIAPGACHLSNSRIERQNRHSHRQCHRQQHLQHIPRTRVLSHRTPVDIQRHWQFRFAYTHREPHSSSGCSAGSSKNAPSPAPKASSSPPATSPTSPSSSSPRHKEIKIITDFIVEKEFLYIFAG